jgi:hypothetical protein
MSLIQIIKSYIGIVPLVLGGVVDVYLSRPMIH